MRCDKGMNTFFFVLKWHAWSDLRYIPDMKAWLNQFSYMQIEILGTWIEGGAEGLGQMMIKVSVLSISSCTKNFNSEKNKCITGGCVKAWFS